MSRTDGWARAQIDQHVMVKTANMAVISKFGTQVRSGVEAKKKSRDDRRFVVGKTKIGEGGSI